MYTYCVIWSQICKGLYSYNNKKFNEKNIDDKNILVTFKKHSYFFKCGILKL